MLSHIVHLLSTIFFAFDANEDNDPWKDRRDSQGFPHGMIYSPGSITIADHGMVQEFHHFSHPLYTEDTDINQLFTLLLAPQFAFLQNLKNDLGHSLTMVAVARITVPYCGNR